MTRAWGTGLDPGGSLCCSPPPAGRRIERRAKRYGQDEEQAINTLSQLYGGIKRQIMRITAASEVWSHGDARMRPSSEEETISDPEARGSGEAVCNAGRR